ncbi:hypothetical protein DL766_001564 [Monosporascus sp. MC13-8B]|uniref:Protein kinase domain-containing protein n=1 Tax=Monosporascus cannonballus TaxID=155416 RepID=A0ABY0GY62_9PEZI|nr:hypothetical protein DL762_007832 [Monosporascus cannonballus]RYO90736.1 hypothetical protein DL763_005205 [Monosporascus cannonballus]RYP37413.1 hypothetical protein DL766_001564 [Monosporascus sp. MC13-8B]
MLERADAMQRAGGHLALPSGNTSQAGFTDPGAKASTLHASQLETIRDEPEGDGVPRSSAARSDFAQEDAVLELLSLRTLAKDKSEFECPFCHIIQDFKREKQWRQHAFSDLKTYVCTMGSGECDLQLFNDSRTWFEHEPQNHRCRWVCTLCRNRSFRSADTFKAHVEAAHPGLSNAEAELLTQAGRRALDLIPAADCPFCDEWEQKIMMHGKEQRTPSKSALTVQEAQGAACLDTPTDVLVVEHGQFRKHVASHMEQLALFAISPVMDDDDNHGSSNATIQSQPDLSAETEETELTWQPDPPLHLAAFGGDVEEVWRLLHDGADVEATGETWGTALSAAETGGHTQVVALLRSWQARSSRPPGSQDRRPLNPPVEKLGQFITASLQLTGIIGSGPFAVLYSAVDATSKSVYAVKCHSKFNADGTPLDRRQNSLLARGVRPHHQALLHPNVLSMMKIIDEPDCMSCGKYVGEDELCLSVFLQLLDAVKHCHGLSIYHRNVKPENILVTNSGQTLKLSGFSLAASADRSDEFGLGSTFYMSPECLEGPGARPYSLCAPNDAWALGVVLVNLTCGRNPWKQASLGDSTYRAYIGSRGFLKTILPLSDGLDDMLNHLFTRDPDRRITIPEFRSRIIACERFTEPQGPFLIAEPPSPEPVAVYNSEPLDLKEETLDVEEELTDVEEKLLDVGGMRGA